MYEGVFSQGATMLEQIKARITEIETAMQNLVSQHAVFVGHLNEAKFFLEMAEKIAVEISPDSLLTECLKVADKVADEVIPE
jgi:hypothetical protein